jgi:hypothetical protein
LSLAAAPIRAHPCQGLSIDNMSGLTYIPES